MHIVDEVRDSKGMDEAGGFMTDMVQARLEPGSDVNFVSLQSGMSQIAVNYRFELSSGSRLRFVGWTGGNPYLRSRITVTLQGDGSEASVLPATLQIRGQDMICLLLLNILEETV